MPRFVEVAKKSQIPEGGAISVVIGETCLALVKLRDEVYALQDTCPHEGGPLSEGELIGENIECPWHRSCFGQNRECYEGSCHGECRHVQGAPR